MAKYEVENRRTGANLGTYEVDDVMKALDVYARQAGYRDYAHACEEAVPEMSEVMVKQL